MPYLLRFIRNIELLQVWHTLLSPGISMMQPLNLQLPVFSVSLRFCNDKTMKSCGEPSDSLYLNTAFP